MGIKKEIPVIFIVESWRQSPYYHQIRNQMSNKNHDLQGFLFVLCDFPFFQHWKETFHVGFHEHRSEKQIRLKQSHKPSLSLTPNCLWLRLKINKCENTLLKRHIYWGYLLSLSILNLVIAFQPSRDGECSRGCAFTSMLSHSILYHKGRAYHDSTAEGRWAEVSKTISPRWNAKEESKLKMCHRGKYSSSLHFFHLLFLRLTP